MNLSEKDSKYIWHPFTHSSAPPPIPIIKGKGTILYDENNNEYIDAISSWWVNIHGHSHPYILERIKDQFQQLDHIIFAGFTHPPAIKLAERLLNILPENHSKIFFSDNGSTSVEVAIKIALQYWHNQGIKKNKIITFKDAYHGDTFGAMSISGKSIFNAAFHDLLFEVESIPVPIKSKEDEVLQRIEELASSDNIAAFIFEPLVLGAGGMIMYSSDILEKIITICKKNNIICIADEVMTGFGRTGKMFATDYLKTKPDIICLSKGITGGTFPLGVTSVSSFIYNAFVDDNKNKTFYHGHSYTANPVLCAVANASLDLCEKPEFQKNIERISNKHDQFRKELEKSQNKIIKDIRQQGTIIAIEIKTENNTSYNNSIRDIIYNYFLERKIILRPLGNIIYILPPYCISNNELDYIYKSINDFLESKL